MVPCRPTAYNKYGKPIHNAKNGVLHPKDADGGLLTLKWKEGLTDEAVLHTWSFTYCPGAGVIFCSWGMCHEAKYEFVKSFDLKGDVEMAHWCLIEEVEPEQPRFERKKNRAVE